MRHPRRALTAVVATVVLVATGCQGTPPRAATIRIGLIANLTGPFEEPGSELRDGFKLYLDMNGGKLGGHPVELIFADEGYERGVAVASARTRVTSRRAASSRSPFGSKGRRANRGARRFGICF